MRKKLEVMRVERMPPMGKLVVAVGEAQYEKLSEVADPATRQRLLAAVGELIDFAGGYQVLVAAGVASERPLATEAQTDAADIAARQEAFLSKLEAERDNAAKPSIDKQVSLLSPLRRTPEPPPKPMSLAEQIDAILQAKVAKHTRFAQRSIHLLPDPEGGLSIEVDGRRYQRPSQIEEKEIAILIKQAIKEWEQSS